jgi:hypothetical protein
MTHESPPSNVRLIGSWRVAWMDLWIREPVDGRVECNLKFCPDGIGEIRFGQANGIIAYCAGTLEGKPCVEFSWHGDCFMDSTMGRGWTVIHGNMIGGMLQFGKGKKAKFLAERIA